MTAKTPTIEGGTNSPKNGSARRVRWEHTVAAIRQIVVDARHLLQLPQVTIDLMHARTVDNDPFYAGITEEFFADARRRHPKLPLVRKGAHGVALCKLPPAFDEYFMKIEPAARRNYKKAERGGFTFSRIDYNAFLGDIGRIRRSAAYRQGPMPESLLCDSAEPTRNPDSRTAYHDYPYFGIVRDGALYAYAGCFIAGELCMIETIYGDAAVQSDGIVPLLIISIARYLMKRHPAVRYYAYGTYFGAREDMRRFKRKFLFFPHRVRWKLGIES